jgi:serine/threonine-protein kinase
MAVFGVQTAEHLIGRVLQDTYRIEALIGEGGMGAVYAASHLRLTRPFAIKVLHRAAASSPQSLARFLREAKIAGSLGHPHIVQVVDVNELPGDVHYIVMEFLEGEDLRSYLSGKGRLEPAAAARIIGETCSALGAAHSHGIIHRDLKPDNIFLCRLEGRQDYVKVLDFGISKVLGSSSIQTQDRTMLGSPSYMAPEQARGNNELVDERTDVYALGATLFEMLAGAPPFSADDIPTLLYQVVHGDTPLLRERCPDISPKIEQVVSRAMAREMDDRFATVGELAAALDRAVAESGAPQPDAVLESRPDTGLQQSQEAVPLSEMPATGLTARLALGRSRWFAVAAAGVVLLGGVVLLLALLRGGSAGDSSPPAAVAASRAEAKTPALRGGGDGVPGAAVTASGPAGSPPLPRAGPPVPPRATSPSPPKQVTVTLRLTPGSARAWLDERPVTGNRIRIERSHRKHTLRISAPGFLAASRTIVPRRDQTVQLRLRARPAAARRKPAGPRATATSDATTRPEAPAKPEAAPQNEGGEVASEQKPAAAPKPPPKIIESL